MCRNAVHYAGVWLIALVAGCWGANVRAADLYNLSLEELASVKISGATLNKESLSQVPASVTVFNRAEIRRLGVKNLDELANYAPGFQSVRNDISSSNYSMSSRGRRVGPGREVLVLLDGQRMNDKWDGGLAHNHALSLGNVERVEFLRGPGSAIYGANAFLGVINIITASHLNELQLGASSHGEIASLNASHGTPGTAQPSLAVFAERRHDRGSELTLSDPGTGQLHNTDDPYDSQDVYLKGSWQNWTAILRSAERRTRDFYTVGYYDDTLNRRDVDSDLAALKYQHSFNDELSVEANASYARRDLYVQGVIEPYGPVNLHGVAEEVERSADLKLFWQRGARKLVLGTEFRQPETVNTDFTVWGAMNGTFPQAANGRRNARGAFFQWQDALAPDWSYILGARHDDDARSGGHTSPRVGLVWHLAERDDLKLLYGEAFRSPNTVELDIVNSPAYRGNPDLKPEISRTSELVWLHSGDTHYFSTTLFNTEIVDAIVDVNEPSPKRRENAGRQVFSGAELEWRWQLGEGWHLQTAFTQIFNQALAVNSEASTLLTSSLFYQRGQWSWGGTAMYRSARYDAETSARGYHRLGGVTVFNLTSQYQLAEDWELYASAINLLDRDYRVPAERTDNVLGVPDRGRELELGVRWRF